MRTTAASGKNARRRPEQRRLGQFVRDAEPGAELRFAGALRYTLNLLRVVGYVRAFDGFRSSEGYDAFGTKQSLPQAGIDDHIIELHLVLHVGGSIPEASLRRCPHLRLSRWGGKLVVKICFSCRLPVVIRAALITAVRIGARSCESVNAVLVIVEPGLDSSCLSPATFRQS